MILCTSANIESGSSTCRCGGCVARPYMYPRELTVGRSSRVLPDRSVGKRDYTTWVFRNPVGRSHCVFGGEYEVRQARTGYKRKDSSRHGRTKQGPAGNRYLVS